MNKKVYIRQDGTIPGHRIIEELERRGADNFYSNYSADSSNNGCYYYICDNQIRMWYLCNATPDYPLEGYTELLYNKETDSFYEKSQRMVAGEAKEALLPNSINEGEYTIQEGYEAKIEDGKVIVKKKEIEPKYKVGDWVVYYHKTYLIEAIQKGYYLLVNQANGDITHAPVGDEDFRLGEWTIQDTKPGDVVFDKSNGNIGIFESIGNHPDGGSCNDPSYCYLHCRYDDGFFYADFEDGNTIDSDDLIPATKEQRALLFKKIDEAGYEWNAEKLELRKKKWQPKEGDKVYYPCLRNDRYQFKLTVSSVIYNSNYEMDKGSLFQTNEEAQAFCDRLNNAIKPILEERRKDVEG